jgi:hypothetical protein
MPSTVIKEADVKYLNKDFQGFKRDLMEYAKAHFSGVFSDYNESSPGMMLLELQAYIGDVLSFYLDQQFNEMRMQTAQQLKNVQLFAKSKGYKPRGPSASSVTQAFFVEVPAVLSGSEYVPDYTFAPRLLAGSRTSGPNGSYFETYEEINFASSSAESPLTKAVTVRDQNTNNPQKFALKKTVSMNAGKTVSDDVTITGFTSFYRYELSQPDVIEIISVVDSDGETWYETDYLSQDTIILPVANSDADNDTVPYVVKLLTVPRRFTVDRDIVSGKTSLQFGSGDGVSFDDEIVPNISDMALPIPGRGYYNNFVLDPQNFLKTTSLGMSPRDVTLTITYRVGGGDSTNVPVGTINTVDSFYYDFSTVFVNPSDVAKSQAVISSLETTNVTKADGGGPAESIPEIKANADAYFAAQGRAVTREDYMAHILAMPSKFGRPEKVYITKDAMNYLALNIHVLAKDAAGHLQLATSNLKHNIARYLKHLRILTDGVNILDGKIINFGVSFGVVIASKFNRTEVLSQCLQAVKEYFNTDRMQIGQAIIRSDVEATLQSVNGVVSVYDLAFTNLFGTVGGFEYSNVRHDFSTSGMKNGIIYCPQDSIFEIKNPNIDIVGETK